ncbi:ATP-binding protein [Acerihabitans sp. KWT182]|uniref:ATP-binding protein n=1 Tax=Acerihabitans sp. KWT182 TaxID=3157919 RepID=A0AAU7Q7L2_9GAMM
MGMNTSLPGRLRNTTLPLSQSLMPLFEAVVNSIHAIAEVSDTPVYGKIVIDIIRMPQTSLTFSGSQSKRGSTPQEPIFGFKIYDNGAGFHARNMLSFETLDSDYKVEQGCRGVGRLLWLKAFVAVEVNSHYRDDTGVMKQGTFSFTAAQGVLGLTITDTPQDATLQTCVHLSGFEKKYRETSPKTAQTIANSLFEHCLWYFVRAGGAPAITVRDDGESIFLNDVYQEYILSASNKEAISIKRQKFELTHLKLKASLAKPPFIAWCAASRVVKEENITGKLPGLHGKIKDKDGDFVYACYVTSSFLDIHARPERVEFDIQEFTDDLFSETEITMYDIRNAIITHAVRYLNEYLKVSQAAGRARIERFVSQRAPRYRPILKRMDEKKLTIPPDISDKDLDLLLHKQLAELESDILSEGQEVMNFGKSESPDRYKARLSSYLEKVDDIKKSNLADYVFHRKVVLDILEKAIQRASDGKYIKEELVHELIMPLRKTSEEVHLDSCNLWLIDERLAFHDFLASDKTLCSMPITQCMENKKPDICALNVYDEPILFSEGQQVPLTSIVIIEIKRPMRNDAAAGEDKDPIEQALGYLERIRTGGARTAKGRPIPNSEDIPGFCYSICDLTPSVIRRCKTLGLTATSDHLGYFGYNPNFKAYIEVISFDRLLNAARERNRAFFDRLGLPSV